jgi:hypothetical protein
MTAEIPSTPNPETQLASETLGIDFESIQAAIGETGARLVVYRQAENPSEVTM